MTLKQLLDVIYCWDGKIVIRNLDMVKIAEFDYKWDSVLVIDERSTYGRPSLYLDRIVVGFTPDRHALDSDEVWLEVIVKEK